jgi:hypothetical protein
MLWTHSILAVAFLHIAIGIGDKTLTLGRFFCERSGTSLRRGRA